MPLGMTACHRATSLSDPSSWYLFGLAFFEVSEHYGGRGGHFLEPILAS